jgi:hypothetical protein
LKGLGGNLAHVEPWAGPVFHRNKLHGLRETLAVIGNILPPDSVAEFVLHEGKKREFKSSKRSVMWDCALASVLKLITLN